MKLNNINLGIFKINYVLPKLLERYGRGKPKDKEGHGMQAFLVRGMIVTYTIGANNI